MDSDVLNLLDELEEIIDRGVKIPMTGKVLVDDSVVFELLDRTRSAMPEEIRNAKWILNERQRIIDEARAEAEKLMDRGKNYVEKMAEDNEIVKQAQGYAEEVVRQAQAYAREVKFGAVQYADELLESIEVKVHETVQAIRRNREELKVTVKEKNGETGEKSE
ncbi:MAG: ATPase [Desulfitobacteriaceae bacterium]|nr:ATPase [Desulfitobacteriaceae bacterium]MDD4346315.1 ATPase [Desulfitobacteriaceae bacterium]MDD4400553.1 ATPase [Desulfitobacteriaceae bacterium]